MTEYKPKLLRRTQFGDPILQLKTQPLNAGDITSSDNQCLIADMSYTLAKRKYGVGIAATQVGRSLAISVIDIKATPTRPDAAPFKAVIINPSFEGIGRKTGLWEGCISMAATSAPVFAKAQRYKRIRATWFDETGKRHIEELDGLPAHVFQHETDHLNGILFPSRVKDHTTWMNAGEYKKRIASKHKLDK